MTEKTKEAPAERSLIKKLARIMAKVERVEKRGENSFHHYKYAMEADLVDAIRPLLAQENVMLLPTMLETVRFQHTNGKGNLTFLTDVKVKWTFEDGDTGETREMVFPGCGEDSGDKGIYKALTGSEKYCLMKTFLIATGDDPEKDTDPPKGEPIKGAKVRDYKLKQPTTSAAAPGGPTGWQQGVRSEIEGELGKVWANNGFINCDINGHRLWTKDETIGEKLDMLSQINGRRPVLATVESGSKPGSYKLIELEALVVQTQEGDEESEELL